MLPNNQKANFEETLGKQVLPHLCIGCGSCVVVCPFNCLGFIEDRPVLIEKCRSCGICAKICPRFNFSLLKLEQFIFGRKRKPGEHMGIVKDIKVGQATLGSIKDVCQDGGVVTSLLVSALEDGIIDGAILSGTEYSEPFKPKARLAITYEDFISSAGTRYSYSPNILALKEGILQKKEKLAFVGTPDQIHAIRRIQALPLRKISRNIVFTIGVFCSECFNYDGIVNNLLRGKLRIKSSEIKKINIKGKMVVTLKSGDTRLISLKELSKYVSGCVNACSDFSAELADIAVGGLGQKGWSLTILRTKIGEDVFEKAVSKGLISARSLEKEDRVFNLLVKMSEKKRENARNFVIENDLGSQIAL